MLKRAHGATTPKVTSRTDKEPAARQGRKQICKNNNHFFFFFFFFFYTRNKRNRNCFNCYKTIQHEQNVHALTLIIG